MQSTTPGGLAWSSLTHSQQGFIQQLPKAELHAHLNGCIPLQCLQELARESRFDAEAIGGPALSESVKQGMKVLEEGVVLDKIDDFFGLFQTIYALISTPQAVQRATRSVLSFFLSSSPPHCDYIELRTTPRETAQMSARAYLTSVLDVLEEFGERAALIVSVDRRMSADDVARYVELAGDLKGEGRPVVAIDLCGDPTKGDMRLFAPILSSARDAGLRLTLHIAETALQTEDDTTTLLSAKPDRLGHATFLSADAQSVVLKEKIPIEICLTSNLLCKTVNRLEDHHVTFWLRQNHPIAICTDDTLPFRNSLWEEYALLLAVYPFGLGHTEQDLERIARTGMASSFR